MNNERRINLFVCGRLCLFGEHSDWAGANRMMNAQIVPGRAVVTGISQGIHATAERAADFSMDYQLGNTDDVPFCCPMDTDALRAEACSGGYDSYVAGVASYICERYRVGGVKITVTQRDLPIKKGLSSSAAICVLVAQAFNKLYHLNLGTPEIMKIAYLGEQRTLSRCGRMDQACAFGVSPVEMTFDGSEVQCRRIPVKKALHFVFADLNEKKDTVKILADLNSAYPFPKCAREEKLHELLGADNWEITDRAVRCIASGEIEQLGKLMTHAQRLFDEKAAPMSPGELAAPALHKMLADESIRQFTYGGKGVGSQGDGAVQFLAKDADSQAELVAYLRSKGLTPYSLTLQSNRGIRKAVIPVAGFGTRMYPETRFVKKEFLPVRDRDGLIKPALLILLEELDASGIEKICLVIHPSERKHYEELLFSPISEEHYAKLPARMQQYENRFRDIAAKVEFAEQREAKGFGHAVYQAAEFADGEPVLLLLGDTIYSSNTSARCARQLMDAFELVGDTTVALRRISPDESDKFGVFCGQWEDSQENMLRCDRIVEKPTPTYAREYLTMNARDGEALFGAFGAYALSTDVFDRLKYAIENQITNDRGEVELTDAIAWIAKNRTVMGFVPDGQSFDLGNPEAYQRAVAEFGNN